MTNPKKPLSESPQAWLNRIRFQCKRGNLETELLLIAYVEKMLCLPSDQKILFENLLNESDQFLFYWLLPHTLQNTESQHIHSIPQQYQPLIADIRDNYLNSSR